MYGFILHKSIQRNSYRVNLFVSIRTREVIKCDIAAEVGQVESEATHASDEITS